MRMDEYLRTVTEQVRCNAYQAAFTADVAALAAAQAEPDND